MPSASTIGCSIVRSWACVFLSFQRNQATNHAYECVQTFPTHFSDLFSDSTQPAFSQGLREKELGATSLLSASCVIFFT
jgi:hypothetical protein